MAGKAESVASHPAGDWDTPFRAVPDCTVGEFSRVGANAQIVDLRQNGSTETRRTNEGVASK